MHQLCRYIDQITTAGDLYDWEYVSVNLDAKLTSNFHFFSRFLEFSLDYFLVDN
jgi:hypothetical protein